VEDHLRDAASDLERIAALLARRNEIDAQIARVVGRPPIAGHPGEWIASRIFDIELKGSATTRAIDGCFRSGPLAGETVNVKWYGKLEGALDMTPEVALDHYLVLAGPRAAAVSSRGGLRPLVIESVHLLDALALRSDLEARGRRIGVASSVSREWWDRSELFPVARHPRLELNAEQCSILDLFGSPPPDETDHYKG
jgi:hypothetical protein